jgi:hypothetical protein
LATELEISIRLLANASHLQELRPQVNLIEAFVFGTICELQTPLS